MYTPDKWIVVTLRNPHTGEHIDKVLAGWYGGYLGSDEWRMNSGISNVEEHEDHYLFHGYSGSVYKCFKHRWGTTGWTASILSNIPEEIVEATNKYEVAE